MTGAELGGTFVTEGRQDVEPVVEVIGETAEEADQQGLVLPGGDAAVGLEQDPADAVVELSRKDKAVKCTRKKYMELREKANGQSYADKLREMGVDSRTVVKVVSEDGKDIDLNESRPKQNYLDLE